MPGTPAVPRDGATLQAWFRYAKRRFSAAGLHFGHGTHNAAEEAAWLLAHVLKLPFQHLEEALGRPVHDRARAKALHLVNERIRTRKPLAYLLHEAWLAGERFYVDKRVIVPRSFIAELLPQGLEPWLPRRVSRILELCTGSGCLAVLGAKAFPAATLDASDISASALAVARRNVAAHRLRRRMRLWRSDLFEALPARRYDLILANPPYVAASSMASLPSEYRHEPKLALAGGRNGLDIALRILEEAPEFLSTKGLLVLEIGHNRKALERARPTLPLTWVTTSAGGDMVMLATRDELRAGANPVHDRGVRRQSRARRTSTRGTA